MSVLLLGGSGLVGACIRQAWGDALQVEAPTHVELDVLDADALAAYVRRSRADAVVNCVGWADVDGAEAQRGDASGLAYRLNAELPGRLAALCTEARKYLVHISTDYVFDGRNAERPYREDDDTNPVCWYAQTKRDGELGVLRDGRQACVARIEMPFTGRAHPKRDLARTIAARLAAGQQVFGVVDQRITPVYIDSLAAAILRIVEAGYVGVIHVASSGWTTPFAFAECIAARLGSSTETLEQVTFERFSKTRPALRPQHSWLDVSRFESAFGPGILRSPEEELEAWAAQYGAALAQARAG